MDFRKFKIKFLSGLIFIGLALVLICFLFLKAKPMNEEEALNQEEITLPQPTETGKISIEEALSGRRSVRTYRDEPLSLEEISQILWATQGITAPQWDGRTAPSAGALYPLEVYLTVRKARGLEPGIYRYLPAEHKLKSVLEGDISGPLAQAALGQVFIKEAPVALVISASYTRTTKKYGQRGIRYVHMEAGHAGQNIYLQAQGLGLGTVTVGAFDDEEVKKILNLSKEETPLYIMPIGV